MVFMESRAGLPDALPLGGQEVEPVLEPPPGQTNAAEGTSRQVARNTRTRQALALGTSGLHANTPSRYGSMSQRRAVRSRSCCRRAAFEIHRGPDSQARDISTNDAEPPRLASAVLS